MVKQASLQWNRLRRYLIADPGRFAGGSARERPARPARHRAGTPRGPDQGKTQGVPRAPPAAHLKRCRVRPIPVTPTEATGINRRGIAVMDMKLEVVVVPVSDVDRAKDFYQGLGWRLDADFAKGEDFRVVQLTPPGSPCSIIFGTGITSAAPGSADGLQLVVTDIEAARDELIGRGAEVSEVFHDAGGVFRHAGTEGRAAARRRTAELRLVRLVQRPGRQRLATPGDHDPPAGPLKGSPMATTLRFREPISPRLCRRAAAAHGKHEERNRARRPGLAGLVRAVHGARARRRGACRT